MTKRKGDSRRRIDEQLAQLGLLRIHLRGETVPCERMDEAWPGLQEIMRDNWAGGAFGD